VGQSVIKKMRLYISHFSSSKVGCNGAKKEERNFLFFHQKLREKDQNLLGLWKI
jgi:hypothetical protein